MDRDLSAIFWATVGVGGIVVSIAAFQAVDPGSIPGQRMSVLYCKIWTKSLLKKTPNLSYEMSP